MKVLNYTGLQNLWTNIKNYITVHTPTKTSDLTNDSNFVDTSNSAVASGITSAKVSSYDNHIADTDIHVTSADKTKWNNGVTQSYVFRYSGTAVVPNSTIAYSTLDNTDNIKAGDKILDVDGKLFEITAVDTTNQTVTVGSALIDLALDGNVVHTSGDETVGGKKTFTNNIILQNSDTSGVSRNYLCKSQIAVLGDAVSGDSTKYIFVDKNNNEICYIRQRKLTNSNTDMSFCVNNIDNDNNSISAEINFVIDKNNDSRISPSVTDFISLGRPTFRWKSIYSNSYYYGNVEFSTKFVTTDTNQTISGSKTFSSNVNVYNSDSTTDTANIVLKNSKAERGSTTNTGEQTIFFLDKNNAQLGQIICNVDSNGYSNIIIQCSDINDSSAGVQVRKNLTGVVFRPTNDNQCWLGQNGRRWYNTYTSKINSLEPSSLSLPVAPSSTSYVDISSYITVLDSSGANLYTPPANGYITFSVQGNQVQIFHDYGLQYKSSVQSGAVNRGFYPVCGGVEYKIYVTASSIDKFWFIPCQGNV